MNTSKKKDNYKELKEKFEKEFPIDYDLEYDSGLGYVWSFISQEIIPMVEEEKVKEIREKIKEMKADIDLAMNPTQSGSGGSVDIPSNPEATQLRDYLKGRNEVLDNILKEL